MTQSFTGTPLLNRQMIGNRPGQPLFNEGIFNLPEKIIQFGTGILLRGLVDYLIDKANKHGVFNGRIVVVKSTGNDVEEFAAQNNLYTVIEKGIAKGEAAEQKTIIASVSRVLPAQTCWPQILRCADDPAIEIIVSNTTEAGLLFEKEKLTDKTPKTFPAKVAAYLWQRFNAFDGDPGKGMIILPTELVSNNGDVLKNFVLQHAADNQLPDKFIDWLNNHNSFCNTLVDRIVPGRSEKDDRVTVDETFTYTDHLHTTVEPYLLWAIEGKETVKQRLSFVHADNRAVVASNIENFKEQKLRILNGSNTAVVGAAFLSGLSTVYDTVTDELFAAFTQQLIDEEIVPTIIDTCPTAPLFAKEVMDRFRNPFIRYPLLNVALQYSGKMSSRNAATINRYHKTFGNYPPLMCIGFAAFLLFYTPSGKENEQYYGMRNEDRYFFRDEHAGFICGTLDGLNWRDAAAAGHAVSTIVSNQQIFPLEFALLPALDKTIARMCGLLMTEGIVKTIQLYVK